MSYRDFDELEDKHSGVRLGILFILAALLIFALTGCTFGYATDGVSKTYIGAVGGKGAGKSKLLALNWDNEKSFNDVAIVALAAVPAIQAVKVAQSSDALSAAEVKSAERVTVNAANNAAATEQLGIKSAVETAKIPKP